MSDSGLASCGACKRLVRERESACPFCKAPRTPNTERDRTKMGRLSRGALLVSAAVALGNPVDSCKRILGFSTGTEAAYGGPPVPVAVYGGPPPTVPIPYPPPATDAGVEDAATEGGGATSSDAGAHPAPKPRDAGVRALTTAYGGPPHDPL